MAELMRLLGLLVREDMLSAFTGLFLFILAMALSQAHIESKTLNILTTCRDVCQRDAGKAKRKRYQSLVYLLTLEKIYSEITWYSSLRNIFRHTALISGTLTYLLARYVDLIANVLGPTLIESVIFLMVIVTVATTLGSAGLILAWLKIRHVPKVVEAFQVEVEGWAK
jgi:hypothetical protein